MDLVKVICDTCRNVFTETDVFLQVRLKDGSHCYIHETCTPQQDCTPVRRTNLSHVTARLKRLTVSYMDSPIYICKDCGKKSRALKRREYCRDCEAEMRAEKTVTVLTDDHIPAFSTHRRGLSRYIDY
jgi:hypothetical protein